jgi:hypothetical protein
LSNAGTTKPFWQAHLTNIIFRLKEAAPTFEFEIPIALNISPTAYWFSGEPIAITYSVDC